MCDVREHDSGDDAAVSAQTFVDELLLALSNSRIYSPDHPRVVSSLEALAGSLARQLEAEGTDAYTLGAADGYLFHDKRPLLAASRSASRLIGLLETLDSGGLSFHRGAEPHEFYALARLLGRKGVEEMDVLQANLALEKEGCPNLRLLPRYNENEWAGDERDFVESTEGASYDLPTLDVPAQTYQSVFDHLTDVITSVFRGNLFRLGDTKSHVESILKNLAADPGAVLTASHYEHTDADQFQFRHSIRVACLALGFAQGVTRDERFLQRLGAAALLHDVGKGRLEDWSVLHHPGRLSDEQRKEMERHSELGARLLLDLEDSDPMAVTIAFGHHRGLTGGGYPKCLHQSELSLATRLVKICDVYEALTAKRPYKDPASPIRSYRIMLNMNEQSGTGMFDPALLHRFILVNGIYPAGSWVRLDNGDVACVRKQTNSLEQPLVSVECEEGLMQNEKVLFAVTPRRLDLRRPDEKDQQRKIVAWLGYAEPKAA